MNFLSTIVRPRIRELLFEFVRVETSFLEKNCDVMMIWKIKELFSKSIGQSIGQSTLRSSYWEDYFIFWKWPIFGETGTL